ncbi:MAG: hypothetical protein H7X86_05740 [Gorillibacterium sp.]|nr:hypothetical protein [Gorillibacterium sp.]
MNESLTALLSKFKLDLGTEPLPIELGGYYHRKGNKKHIIVNNALPYDKKIEICYELVFKHCLDEKGISFIPCYLSEETTYKGLYRKRGAAS